MADRGLALLDADAVLVVIEERGELRVAAAAGEGEVRLRVMPVQGSALGELYLGGEPVAMDRPRGKDAADEYDDAGCGVHMTLHSSVTSNEQRVARSE